MADTPGPTDQRLRAVAASIAANAVQNIEAAAILRGLGIASGDPIEAQAVPAAQQVQTYLDDIVAGLRRQGAPAVGPAGPSIPELARAIPWPRDTKVGAMGLDTTLVNVLQREGVLTLGELADTPDDHFDTPRNVRHFGPKTRERLRQLLITAATGAPPEPTAAEDPPEPVAEPTAGAPTLTADRSRVLEALAINAACKLYAGEISELTGIDASRVRNALSSFATSGWVTTEKEEGTAAELGRPVRRYAQITDAGLVVHRAHDVSTRRPPRVAEIQERQLSQAAPAAGTRDQRVAQVIADVAGGKGMTRACEDHGLTAGDMMMLRKADPVLEAQVQTALEEGRAVWAGRQSG